MSEEFFRRHLVQAEPRHLRELAERLRDLDTVTPELFSDVIRAACQRLPSVRRTKQFERLEHLIQSGAWTDAVLALLELELPQWQLRRVAYDAGEWHCVLSRQRELPDWLDQSVEARHAGLSLAILRAFVGVKRASTAPAETVGSAKPDAIGPLYEPMCCDNFV
jgi:hypothetical protein